MASPYITEQQLLEKLHDLNPWWKTGEIDAPFRAMNKRLYFWEFSDLVQTTSINRAVILMGPRRVGKTIMIFQAIQKLIDKGVAPKKICYFSIDSFYNIGLEQLLKLHQKAVGISDSTDGFYVFFDEIQYLANWEMQLKVLVDFRRTTKFIASGSAAAALNRKSKESGVGRFTDFALPPLTFQEYLKLKDFERDVIPKSAEWQAGVPQLDKAAMETLNKHFFDYINFGGYPELSLSDDLRKNPSRYFNNDIVDKVLQNDLPSLYGIQDVQELQNVFKIIALNSGNTFSYEEIFQKSGIAKNTIKKYIEYLEAAFLIKTVQRIDDTGKRFKRAIKFKIYLTNPSLGIALSSPIDTTTEGRVLGFIVETAIYAQLFHQAGETPYYAQLSKGEVDIVWLNPANLKPHKAVEIKWSNRFHKMPELLKKLLHFLKGNKLDKAIVTTIDIQDEKEVDGCTLHYIPAALYCYLSGYREEPEIPQTTSEKFAQAFAKIAEQESIAKTKEAVLEVYDKSIKYLAEDFVKYSKQFDNLYVQTNFYCFFEGLMNKQVATSLAQMEVFRTRLIDNKVQVINLEYDYQSLNYDGFEHFKYRSKIVIQFKPNSYIVRDAHNKIVIEKNYKSRLTSSEIERLIQYEIKQHELSLQQKIEQHTKKV